MSHMTLRLQNAELRSHRRVARVAGKVRHHFGGCGAATAVQHVDDLPLAPAEDRMKRFGHM
jgi:hypothetical protein